MNKKELKRKENHEQELVYYDSLYKALIQNQFEIGRQLVTLSALAIGLLVGVVGKPYSLYSCEFWIWILACSSFLFCIVSILFALRTDAIRVNAIIDKYTAKNTDNPSKKELKNKINKKEKQVDIYECVAKLFFILGIISTIIVVLLDIAPDVWKGNQMPKDKRECMVQEERKIPDKPPTDKPPTTPKG